MKPKMTIPFDAKLFVGAENEGKKLTDQKSGSEIVNRFLPIARNVLNQSEQSSADKDTDTGLNGFINKILKKG